MRIGSVFNRLAGKFSDIPNKKPKGKKGLETGACYWLVKVTLTNENRAYLIWRHHGGNTTTLWQTCIVNGCKTVQVAGNGVAMHGYILHFSGSGLSLSRSRYTQEKCCHVISCLHHSLWRAENDRTRSSAPEWNRIFIWQSPPKASVDFYTVIWNQILRGQVLN